MRARLALLGALLALAGCGGPPSTPQSPAANTPAAGTTVVPATPAPPTLDAGTPTASPATACRMDEAAVNMPTDPDGPEWFVDGVTPAGELLLVGVTAEGIGHAIEVLDTVTGTATRVIARKPESFETATSGISGPSGTADWIVWQQSGFSLDESDWTMFVHDRRTGENQELASFEPGSNGIAPPGWASDVAILGEVAAWSAPVEIDGRVEQRIYAADLDAARVERLAPEARWPYPVSADTLVALVLAGTTDENKALSEPSEIDLSDGSVTSLGILEPDRLLAFAASPSGLVALRRIGGSPDGMTVEAEAVTQLHGVVRRFPLEIDWAQAGAGNGFVAWSDDQHLWILTVGMEEPVLLEQVSGTMGNLRFRANGEYLFWHTDEGPTNVLMRVTCP